MNIFSFDNTFEGLLTLVFDSYQQRQFPDEILSGEGSQPVLFASTNTVETDDRKAEQVWKGIVKHSSEENAHRVYRVFLAGMPDTPKLLVKYIRLIIDSVKNEETNFSEPVVVEFDDLKVNPQNGQLHLSLLAEDEKLFQQLWKQYYHSICIQDRKNDKVHRQLLPQRFWKYLPEKGFHSL